MHFDNNCGLAHKNLSSFALTPQQFYALLYSRIIAGYQGIHITCQFQNFLQESVAGRAIKSTKSWNLIDRKRGSMCALNGNIPKRK